LFYTITTVGYAAFMLLILKHSSPVSGSFVYKFIARIGVYSYGIYLWHVSVRSPCVWFASHLSVPLQWPVGYLSQFVAAIVLGICMSEAVEIPSLRLREKLFPPTFGARPNGPIPVTNEQSPPKAFSSDPDLQFTLPVTSAGVKTNSIPHQ
jgi:peptidoglycan/LPS O-acetylase OafA/YrhL